MTGESTFNTINNYIVTMFGSDLFDRASDWLKIGDDGPYATVWSTVGTLYNSLAAIGVGVMMLCLAIRVLSDLATTGPPTFEMIFKHVARMLIGYVVVVHGLDILKGIVGFSDDLFDQVKGSLLTDSGSLPKDMQNDVLKMFFPTSFMETDGFKGQTWGEGAEPTKAYLKAFKKLSWGEQLSITINGVTHAIEQYIAWFADVYVIIVCIGRAVQICAYTMVAPLAMADCVSGGDLMSSHAFRFARKFFAVLLQGLMVLLVIYACRIIQASMLSNKDLIGGAFGSAGCIIALRLAQLKLIQQSQQFASDVVGG